MFHNTQFSRRKGTAVGASLAALGLLTMLASPYIALSMSVLIGIIVFHIIFIVGFVLLLYGVGYILLANNFWGS
jgi:uncharacterized membrane protein